MKKAEELAREYHINNGLKRDENLGTAFMAGYKAALSSQTDKVQILIDALEFYEDEYNHGVGQSIFRKSNVNQDCGQIATKALEAYQIDEG